MFDIVKILVFITVSLLANNWLRSKFCSRELSVLIIFILSRLFFNSFHEYTFSPLFAGLSVNSLHSIFFCGVLLLFIPNRLFLLTSNKWIFLIILFMLFSAIINDVILKSAVSIVKWLLLAEFIVLFLYALAKDGFSKVSVALAIAYLYPIVMLVMSVVFGVSKASESDGSTSYVGGFFHEAVFSMIIYSGLVFFLVVFKEYKIQGHYVLLLIAIFTIFLLLINYRTTLLAEVVLLGFALISYYWKGKFSWKFSVLSLLCIFIFSLVYFNYDVIVERFSDLPAALSVFGELISSPELFTKVETKLLSGRLYIWSSYVDYVLEGPLLNQFVGYGMDSWDKIFLKYAHNSFISFYFEVGLIGFFLLILFFLYYLKYIFVVKDRDLRVLLLGIYLSFVVLNLATMPLWAIEGIFFFSFVCSSSFFLARDVKIENA